MKFKALTQQLEEDNVMPDVNIVMSPGVDQDYSPSATSQFDMLTKKYASDEAPDLQPYPLNHFTDVASDAFIKISNLVELIKQAKNNPAVKNKLPLAALEKELDNITKEIVEINGKVAKIK
jgi:hypothetical protein